MSKAHCTDLADDRRHRPKPHCPWPTAGGAYSGTLFFTAGCGEPALATYGPGQRVQFERLAYFCVDPDSRPGKPVFTMAHSSANKIRQRTCFSGEKSIPLMVLTAVELFRPAPNCHL